MISEKNMQGVFVRHLVSASKKVAEKQEQHNEIKKHIDNIKTLKKEDAAKELDKLKDKISNIVYEQNYSSQKDIPCAFTKRLEYIEEKLDDYHKRIQKAGKAQLKQELIYLEAEYDSLRKKYPKKNFKKIKARIERINNMI